MLDSKGHALTHAYTATMSQDLEDSSFIHVVNANRSGRRAFFKRRPREGPCRTLIIGSSGSWHFDCGRLLNIASLLSCSKSNLIRSGFREMGWKIICRTELPGHYEINGFPTGLFIALYVMLIYRLQTNTFSFWLRENFRRGARRLAVSRKINSKSYLNDKRYILS